MSVKKEMNRETFMEIARTALRTKLSSELADHIAEVCVVANLFLL